MNILDSLKQRGFVKQTVYEDDLRRKLENESVPFYIGFDPTADSLHIGHFVQLMAMRHMQLAGHRPIALIGGATAMIGDPSGRNDMRSMMTPETIQRNCEAFRKQMSRFISFEGENGAVMVNNADWLLDLNYMEFIRDIGAHFSVNRMLSAECFKSRLDTGLTFLEFNYMLMQSYDFLVLFREHGCSLQLGGDDQWSNILAGADLIRRKEGKDAFAMTFTLLLTSDGRKMGKTAKGALWLDEEKTSPYEFYQYFRSVDDGDVENCLKLLTFMPLSEIESLTAHRDERMNEAKRALAFEVTKLIHGEQAAAAAEEQAKAAFSGDAENMPQITLPKELSGIAEILVAAKLAPSKAEARRLITSGGIKVGEEKVTDPSATAEGLTDFVLHKGKKSHIRVTLV